MAKRAEKLKHPLGRDPRGAENTPGGAKIFRREKGWKGGEGGGEGEKVWKGGEGDERGEGL